MRERHRPMRLSGEGDICGVGAETYSAAVECVRKEIEISKTIAAVLLQHYPGYPWEIKTEMERAASMIRLPIMPPNVYYILPFREFMDGPSLHEKVVKMAGGELLERFDLSRNGIKFDEYEEARPRKVLVDDAGDTAKPKLLPGLGGAPEPCAAPKLILPN